MGTFNWLKNTAKNVGNVFFDDWIETEKEKKGKEAKSAQIPAMQSGRDAEGRTVATYGNNTQTNSNISNDVGAGAFDRPSTIRPPATHPYTSSYGGVTYKPRQPKSSFVEWNIEKTQPKLSYGQERLIQSANPSRNPWLDATLRNYLTKPNRPTTTNVDKPAGEGYNNGTEYEYKSPAYEKQMSYRGLQRGTYNSNNEAGRKRELENGINSSSYMYDPKTQQAILKEGLINAELKYNGKSYANYSDGYDREEEALDFLADNIVYGSERDSDMVFSWGKRQKNAGEWLGEVFGEGKKEELIKRLDQKLKEWNYETHHQNGEKYKNYTSEDFELPDVAQYKAEHNIGADDEELKNWETVLDVLQAGIDVAGLIPGIGFVPDLINTAIYAMRGDWKNAGFSAKKQQKENNNYNENVPDVLKLANETKNMIQNYGENVYFHKEVIPKQYYVEETVPDTKCGIKLSDAATMADVVYTLTMNEADNEAIMKKYNEQLGGWRYLNVISGADSATMGVFFRPDTDTGKNEFIIVSAGTGDAADWKNNVQQITGDSADMKYSVDIAKRIENAYGKDTKITFVGHSKGGAEAMANAIATNRNAIVFNPAKLYPEEYGLNTEGYTGSISSYIVDGDILNSIQNNYNNDIADTTYLPRQYRIYPGYPHSLLSGVNIWNAVQNHGMKSVINALKEK